MITIPSNKEVAALAEQMWTYAHEVSVRAVSISNQLSVLENEALEELAQLSEMVRHPQSFKTIAKIRASLLVSEKSLLDLQQLVLGSVQNAQPKNNLAQLQRLLAGFDKCKFTVAADAELQALVQAVFTHFSFTPYLKSILGSLSQIALASIMELYQNCVASFLQREPVAIFSAEGVFGIAKSALEDAISVVLTHTGHPIPIPTGTIEALLGAVRVRVMGKKPLNPKEATQYERLFFFEDAFDTFLADHKQAAERLGDLSREIARMNAQLEQEGELLNTIFETASGQKLELPEL